MGNVSREDRVRQRRKYKEEREQMWQQVHEANKDGQYHKHLVRKDSFFDQDEDITDPVPFSSHKEWLKKHASNGKFVGDIPPRLWRGPKSPAFKVLLDNKKNSSLRQYKTIGEWKKHVQLDQEEYQRV